MQDARIVGVSRRRGRHGPALRFASEKMVDPLTTAALAVAKATAMGEVKKRIAGFLDRNTTAVEKEYAEAVADWAIEARLRAQQTADESASRIAELGEIGGRVEDLEHTLARALGEAPVLLCAIYEDEAGREPLAERRKMLAHAAAGIGDLFVSFTDKCRAERALRPLFPEDIIVLDQLHRLVGDVRRLPGGMGRNYQTEGAHRSAVLHASRSAAPLITSGCVYEQLLDRNKWGESAFAEARVTPIGELVLYVLRSFLTTRRQIAPGREPIPGERGEEAARQMLGAEFYEGVRRVCRLGRGAVLDFYRPIQERPFRVQFSIPRPSATPLESTEHALKDVRFDDVARLHIYPVASAIIDAVPTPSAPVLMKATAITDRPGNVNVQIEGPFDVLRWLADDIDAWWT